jgi:hypothetical protein
MSYEEIRLFEEKLKILKGHPFKLCLASALYKKLKGFDSTRNNFKLFVKVVDLQHDLIEILKNTKQEISK